MDNHLAELKQAFEKAKKEYYIAVIAYMSEILREAGLNNDVNILLPAKKLGCKGVLCIRNSPFNGTPETVFYPYTKSGTLSKDIPSGLRITLYDCEQCTKESIINNLKMCYAPAATEEVAFDA